MMRQLNPCRIAAFALSVAVLTSSPGLLAQPRDPAAADALFRQAREAVKRGDYALACPKFAESQRLDPAAGTLLNLAQCEEKIGKLASAAVHYRDAADQLPAGDPRAKVAMDGLAAIEKRIPHLTITLPANAPADTKVTRDGVELGAASLGVPLPVDPGEHTIVTRAPGRKEASVTLSLKEAESRDVQAVMGAAESAAPAPVAPPVASPAPATASTATVSAPGGDGNTQRYVGYAAIGLGVIGIGVGTVYSLKSRSLNNDALETCSESTCSDQRGIDLTNDARSAGKIGIAGFAVGGVALAGGLYAVLTASPGPKKTERVSVSPAAGPGNMGLVMKGVW